MLVSFYSQSRFQLVNKLSELFEKDKSQQRCALAFRQVYKEKPYESSYQFQNISQNVSTWLNSFFSFSLPVSVSEFHLSEQDASVKFALRLERDGKLVEAVLIPERGRLTLCLSTQVGCAQGCRFCQTGRMGLVRNLDSEEIIGQFLAIERWRKSHQEFIVANYRTITNIVFMGMGEPLDNADAVIEAINIFCDPLAFNLSHNKITVSTVGILPALERILQETKARVALSLHSPFDAERSRVMPVNLHFPIDSIINCLRKYAEAGVRDSFMIQYTLLRGINDSPEHACAIAKLLVGIPAKLNLIPLNEHEGASFRRPDLGRVYEFQQSLKNLGMVATIRLSKGRDIQAACGQLIKNKMEDML